MNTKSFESFLDMMIPFSSDKIKNWVLFSLAKYHLFNLPKVFVLQAGGSVINQIQIFKSIFLLTDFEFLTVQILFHSLDESIIKIFHPSISLLFYGCYLLVHFSNEFYRKINKLVDSCLSAERRKF